MIRPAPWGHNGCVLPGCGRTTTDACGVCEFYTRDCGRMAADGHCGVDAGAVSMRARCRAGYEGAGAPLPTAVVARCHATAVAGPLSVQFTDPAWSVNSTAPYWERGRPARLVWRSGGSAAGVHNRWRRRSAWPRQERAGRPRSQSDNSQTLPARRHGMHLKKVDRGRCPPSPRSWPRSDTAVSVRCHATAVAGQVGFHNREAHPPARRHVQDCELLPGCAPDSAGRRVRH